MSVMIILIIVSIIVALCFLIAFLWNVNSGQYDDDYTPSIRILFEDENQNTSSTNNQNIKS